MDKETLSNYGWIVICVLVLAVMLALAGPFGTFVAGAVKSTTAGLFGVNQNALGAAGITIDGQEFESNGAGNDTVDLSGKTEVAMLDGDRLKYNRAEPIVLSFRSPAEFADFETVLVDGQKLDASKYTVTEGSTIVTFTPEYSAELALGDHTVDIVSKTSYAKGAVVVIETVPPAANDGKIEYGVGDPDLNVSDGTTPKDGSKFTYGDYEYNYVSSWNGWNAKVIDKKKTSYGPLLETINGKPLTAMSSTFNGCTSITDMGDLIIPATVTQMSNCFYGCKKLTVAPAIPASVENMHSTFRSCEMLKAAPDISHCTNLKIMAYTFYLCYDLTTVSAIPSSVEEMPYTFTSCVSLTSVTIHATPTKYLNCMGDSAITEILGDCGNKTTLLGTR